MPIFSLIMRISLLVIFTFFFLCTIGQSQKTVGVIELNDGVSDGYTLIIPSSSRSTFLIDNCGQVINQWNSEYNAGLMAYILPDGRLLRAGRTTSQFAAGGSGGVIEIFSWEGDLEWSFFYSDDRVQQHHDMEVLPNGNLLLLAWVKLNEDEILSLGRQDEYLDLGRGFWSEQVVEIRPIGFNDAEIVWEWNSHDHYVQDVDTTKNNYGIVEDHPELLDINYPYNINLNGDWLHFNSVDYNVELDQILLGSRNHNEIYIIDHSTTIAEAASHSGGRYGKGGDILYRWGNPIVYKSGTIADRQLFGQHDPHWLDTHNEDNDLIMIFNNGLGRNPFYSSIDVIDTGHENGIYSIGDEDRFGPDFLEWTIQDINLDFTSPRISGAQFLENRSTLICAGNVYKILEVTESDLVAWQYVNPVSNLGPISQGDNSGGRDMFRTHKYSPDFSGFEDKDLTPGDKLELDPIEEECLIMDIVSVQDIGNEISLYPNPTADVIFINGGDTRNYRYEVYNSTGLKLTSEKKITQEGIDISELKAGIYFIKLLNDHNQKSYKVIKL